jgi:hypothetical protein
MGIVTNELAPAQQGQAPERRSALDDFLNRAVAHERMGGMVSPFLLKAALIADLALLALVLIGSTISGNRVGQSSFFIIGGGIVAGLIHLLQALTWPLLAVAVTGIGLNIWSRDRRTPEAVHVLCAAQAVPVLTLSFGWVLVMSLFVLELIIWIAMVALATALLVALVAGLFASVGS